ERSLLRRTVQRRLEKLPERERPIVERRFGLQGEPQTLERVGHELGLTRERVHQLEAQALKQLETELADLAPVQTAAAGAAPERVDFRPGALLGSVSGELGLRKFLEQRGHRLVVTSDKDGPDSVFERELGEAEIVISQPFWPAYLTAGRIAKARKLRLAVTAGIGSDHVDLQAAIERGITVAEVTYSNSISVAEHVVMMILALVRNYIPSYHWVVEGGWNIADCVARSYDLEGMQVGTVAAGRIGSAVLRRLKPFEVGLHYTDRHRLPEEPAPEPGVTSHPAAAPLGRAAAAATTN